MLFQANWKPTKSKTCSRSSSNFSCLPFKLTPDTGLLENVYAGDRLGGNWLDQPVVLVDCGTL